MQHHDSNTLNHYTFLPQLSKSVTLTFTLRYSSVCFCVLKAGGLEAGCGVHVVLGGPEVDVDTVASILSLALHLSQVRQLSCQHVRLKYFSQLYIIHYIFILHSRGKTWLPWALAPDSFTAMNIRTHAQTRAYTQATQLAIV